MSLNRFNSKRYLQYHIRNPHSTAKDDRSAFKVMHKDLRPQYEWYGDTLTYTGFMVHKRFLDDPNPQGKTKALPGDPFPVIVARPFYVAPTTEVTTEFTGNTVFYSIAAATPVVVNPAIQIELTTGTDLSKGILLITPSYNISSLDTLSIKNVGNVSASGNLVFYSGVNIGTFSNGTKGNPLQIRLISGANITKANEILQSVQFFTTSTEQLTKTFSFVVIDNNGVSSDAKYSNVIIQP